MVKEVTLKTSDPDSPVWLAMSNKYISINEIHAVSHMAHFEADEVICEITFDKKMAIELIDNLTKWIKKSKL